MYQLLVVDDQAYLADDLSAMLPWGTLGIGTVHTAYTAYEALELLRTHPIDIVITDIRMPGMSGIELIEEIRKHHKLIKTILVSGYSDFEYAKKAIQNRTTDYLLKPVSDEDLLDAVQRAISSLQSDWMEISSKKRLEQSVRENMPILKEHLLRDLLSGRRLSASQLEQRIGLLGLPLAVNRPCCLLLVRMEDHFEQFDPESLSLFEYAIFNMAAEIFGTGFQLLHCRDIHDYLVLLLTPKAEQENSLTPDYERQAEQMAALLQHYTKLYLKGTISVLQSPWVPELAEVNALYGRALQAFRQQIGGERELLLTCPEAPGPGKARSLGRLYEPPTLLHLLEAGQWDQVRTKLEAIFAELNENWADSHEHILETYFAIASAFACIIHKSNRWISQVLEQEYGKLSHSHEFHTIQQLRDWTFRVLEQFTASFHREIRDARSATVKQVHEYVEAHLGEASLQSIASHVYLNPSYLSKIYKSETGEGISDYLYRLRMEKAAYRLANSNEKIYEIALSLGYLKTSYFIKLFKEKYGVTPQEYRDQLLGKGM
ncbi:response regulator transcription factor [Gorillibacterium sp. sgz5001074]|uniref:response regulator transcription factor n=1 Tax=Gorillibacterium sp. sgz5001074 TaxID=3446695 RepID=UPI003F674218